MRRRLEPGALTALLVLTLATLPLLMLVWRAGALPDFRIWQDAYLMRVLRFSLWQAGLSTLFSVVPAMLVARALARRPNLPGRRLLLGMLGLPLVVPSVVAVLGVVAVFGAGGWLPLGRDLYGLKGILIAHVFFNLPLAARLLLPSLEQVPAAQWRLARQLGMNQLQTWRHLEWPALRGALPATALLVFMLCLTSFAVVLTLGGGPRSTTLEVAIYQSLRFDFEPSRAVLLAIVQLALCALLAAIAMRLSLHRRTEIDVTLETTRIRDSVTSRIVDALVLLSTLSLLAAVLIAILVDGLSGPLLSVLSSTRLWSALGLSILIALSAATLATLAGWMIVGSSARLAADGHRRYADTLEIAGSVVYVVPPLVIGTGYFLLLHGYMSPDSATLPIVIMVNAMMGLPFVIRSLGPGMRQRHGEYGRLCHSLGISGWTGFRLVYLPLLRRPLGLGAALVAALSFGDLGVVALFAGDNQVTLPLLLYQYLSAYRMPAAAVVALVLLGACLALFLTIERIAGGPRIRHH